MKDLFNRMKVKTITLRSELAKLHSTAMLPPKTRSTCKEPEREKGLEHLLPETKNVDSGN